MPTRPARLFAALAFASTAACNNFSVDDTIPGHVVLVVNSLGGVIPFSRVQIVLKRTNDAIAADTTVNYPAGAQTLSLDVNVRLKKGTDANGEQMSLMLLYQNASGQTVSSGGPVTVSAKPK